ncbi:MAG TPA: HD domain-containing protein [Acidimicrobiales bacterium]|nr:HD domain-containing protein [Acidimicrobiales bacterium]
MIHLAKRFFGSLRRGGPADEAWALARLNDGERALWVRMSDADRRHAVGVAQSVPADLAVAALLHDVGKVESGLGTFARVGATLLGAVRRDWGGRLGVYLRHDAIGAELLAQAGSAPLTVAWAREHHLPEDRWTVPLDAGRALKAADDD